MRLTKRQLKRIIREEYSRLKRRGLIKESKLLDREQKQRIHAYCEYMGFGGCKVISCDDGLLTIPIRDFEDVLVNDMQQLRTEIEGISGDLVGVCEDAKDDYFAKFDTLICVRNGELMVCGPECWELLPSAIYAGGVRTDGTVRPACRFKMNADMCQNIGSIEDAMAFIAPMGESRRRRRTVRRNRRY